MAPTKPGTHWECKSSASAGQGLKTQAPGISKRKRKSSAEDPQNIGSAWEKSFDTPTDPTCLPQYVLSAARPDCGTSSSVLRLGTSSHCYCTGKLENRGLKNVTALKSDLYPSLYTGVQGGQTQAQALSAVKTF